MGDGKTVGSAMDRSVTADLWRNTLSNIPSVYGRLVYLASLRSQNSGKYEHHGLSLVFGGDAAEKALRKSHRQVFAEWLSFSLHQQKSDLDLYISSLEADRHTVVENWSEFAPHRYLIPAFTKGVEKELYLSDMAALIELLRRSHLCRRREAEPTE